MNMTRKGDQIIDEGPKVGDVVFTKKIHYIGDGIILDYSSQPKTYFITLLLGTLKDRNKKPTKTEYWQILSSIGLTTFDEVEEALGVDAMKKVMAHVAKKYELEGELLKDGKVLELPK